MEFLDHGRHIRYIAFDFYPQNGMMDSVENIEKKLKEDLDRSGMSLDDLKHRHIILDFLAEGQCDQTINPLMDYLKDLPVGGISVLFNTSVDTESLPYPSKSVPQFLSNLSNWFDKVDQNHYSDLIDKKFLCLMRRPSISRAKIAQSLIELPSVRLSFGCADTDYELEEYKPYFPDRNLPILIDGYLSPGTGLEQVHQDPMFHSCTFNIVVESSSQTDPNIWRSIFITEKTYKAFGFRQIPIWFAVPGLVKEVRKLGFDLFDDIVDHSYDKIQDQTQRFQQVIGVINELDKKFDLEACQSLRQKLAPRLEKNYKILKEFSNVPIHVWRINEE